ncbi:MAG: M23 family metallopeptidase, partial [Lacticaseibacillus paracasei]
LRGEGLAPNTPGSKIPSHGSNKFGTRYAYDFVQVNWKKFGRPAYHGNLLRYLFRGIPINDYYCWGQPIYSPANGLIIRAEDHYPERERTSLFGDLRRARNAAHNFDPKTNDIQAVAGNFVILQIRDDVYAVLCHLQTNSIRVVSGQEVKTGDFLGCVGHSGNSFGPHLHFQLMNSSNIEVANGLPCAFAECELFSGNSWKKEENVVPSKTDRIRFISTKHDPI